MEDPDDAAAVDVTFLVNKVTKKVVFAQAQKDFVDILASFLTYPLGTLSELLGANSVASIKSIHKCLESFNGSFFWNGNKAKGMLLNPRNSAATHFRYLAVKLEQPTAYYLCPNHNWATRSKPSHKCSCEEACFWEFFLDHPHKGFVNDDDSLYMIMDDLNVRPFSVACSTIAFRQDTPAVVYEKRQMKITKAEVRRLLRLTICSKNPLTDFVFGRCPLREGWSGVWDADRWDVGEPNNTNLSIKIMIHKPSNRLVCAYCDGEFLDVLLSFLTFPLGGVVNALGRRTSLGSIDTLYESISNLNHPNLHTVLHPLIAHELSGNNTILPIEEPRTRLHFHGKYTPPTYLGREKLVSYCLVEELSELQRPSHFQEVLLQSDSARKAGKGFLKESFVYMVEPDLNFRRISPVFDIGFPQYFSVEIYDVEEKCVNIGINEVLMILKASLTSCKPLDDALKHLFPGFDGGEG